MALVASYVANHTQISFHHSLIFLDWIRIENVIESESGDGVEVRAGVPQWVTWAAKC